MSAAHIHLHIMFVCLVIFCLVSLVLEEFVLDEEIILYVKFPERWLLDSDYPGLRGVS